MSFQFLQMLTFSSKSSLVGWEIISGKLSTAGGGDFYTFVTPTLLLSTDYMCSTFVVSKFHVWFYCIPTTDL